MYVAFKFARLDFIFNKLVGIGIYDANDYIPKSWLHWSLGLSLLLQYGTRNLLLTENAVF